MTDRTDADDPDDTEEHEADTLWGTDDDPEPDTTETVPLEGSSTATEDWNSDGDATQATPGVPEDGSHRPPKQPVGAEDTTPDIAKSGNDDPEPATPSGPEAGVGSPTSDSAETANAEADPPEPPVADMTLVLTYDSVTQFADPEAVFASAREWADWVGLVGDVSAPDIHMLQRDLGIEADFLNGTDVGPVERLQNVTGGSKFYAERLVVVGPPDDEWMAAEADWEFIPLAEAAEKAGWDLQ